jgi:hypothetical protein
MDLAIITSFEMSLDPLRAWWHSTIEDGQSVGSFLEGSFSDSLLGDGVWACIESANAGEVARQLAKGYLNCAVEIVSGKVVERVTDVPIWTTWIAESVRALDYWQHIRMDSKYSPLAEDLQVGMDFIRNGFPTAAASYWAEVRHATRVLVRRKQILQARAQRSLAEAQQLSTLFQVPLPDLAEQEGDEILATLAQWAEDLRNNSLAAQFWEGRLVYLTRLQKVTFMLEAKALLRSAAKRSVPTLKTLEKLITLNRKYTDMILQDMHHD